MRAATALAIVLALGTLGVPRARAYVPYLIRDGDGLLLARWPERALPIRMRLNDQLGPNLPNISPDSDPVGAIERAVAAWPAISGVTMSLETTHEADAVFDRINVITFADTRANQKIFEMSGGKALAVTLITLGTQVSQNIVETDIAFNPAFSFTTAPMPEPRHYDIESIAIHELGHVIGLSHTGVASASMWSFASVGGDRGLDPDDVAGAQAVYPPDGENRMIRGIVTLDGRRAYGAQVVAVSTRGPVVSVLTRPDGTYAIEHLPDEQYSVYVEPLDGPFSVANADDCLRFGNLVGAGIYDGARLTTALRTTFFGGVETPTLVTPAAPASAPTVNFNLPIGTDSINPVAIGGGDPSEPARAFTVGLTVHSGTEPWVVVAGANIDLVEGSGVSVLGNDVTVDAASRLLLPAPADARCGGPRLGFRIAIAPGAVPGGRTLLLRANGESVALTGALRVVAGDAPQQTPTSSPTRTVTPTPSSTPTPPPTRTRRPTGTPAGPQLCVGDCDGDHVVRVDEILRGIDILLGRLSPAVCTRLDRDGGGQATLDEVVQAVAASLYSCLPE